MNASYAAVVSLSADNVSGLSDRFLSKSNVSRDGMHVQLLPAVNDHVDDNIYSTINGRAESSSLPNDVVNLINARTS